MTERILGLIPAKGASQRLPRKNLSELGGRTLLEWAVEATNQSNLCSKVIISTEDEEVARLARGLGLDVPFLRPTALALDPASVVDVALHTLEELDSVDETYDTIIIVLPTCPFRSSADIQGAYDLFQAQQRPCVMSVSEFTHTPYAGFRCDQAARLTPLFPQYIGKKSQEMPCAYRPNGAVHVLDVDRFRTERSYFFEPLVGYVMPQERSIDIDSELDLIIARSLLSLIPDIAS